MAKSDAILITSTDEVPGRQTARVIGLVRGHSVRARNMLRDMQAGIRTIIGGRVGVYAELLEEAREEAIGEMVESALGQGANAVVATRLTTSQVMGGASEVVAYGTAVVLD